MSKDIKDVQSGSLEWLQMIAEILGKSLVGIEYADYRRKCCTDVVYVYFVIRQVTGEYPNAVLECMILPNYCNITDGRRGYTWVNHIKYGFRKAPFPAETDILKLAEKLGFTYMEEQLNSAGRIQLAFASLYLK